MQWIEHHQVVRLSVKVFLKTFLLYVITVYCVKKEKENVTETNIYTK